MPFNPRMVFYLRRFFRGFLLGKHAPKESVATTVKGARRETIQSWGETFRVGIVRRLEWITPKAGEP
ncbi:MAG TPA: hypothetical protein PLN52_06395 [Opitutaceae bacterium]|nr:hypothetical protein [Opitutaceae bacterium]